MPRTRTLAIIQAGGAGGRMDVLTRERPKPALPFAGVYQLLDFPLSNLAHSGVTDVWLSVQYQAADLQEQVANGRPWDLDRNRGGLQLLMPEQGTGSVDEEGFTVGNADGLFRVRDRIRALGPSVLIVLSADHVYRLDYNDAIETHLANHAECTVVTTDVDLADASNHATVESSSDGRVTGFAYKPEEPTVPTVATEVFLYDPEVLVSVLEELHRERTAEAEEGDTGLGDYGELLLPRLVERGRTFAHPLPGYWRDVGQPHLYLAAHLEIVEDDQSLFEPDWPILTGQPQRPAALVHAGARITDSRISQGAAVSGTVRRSVLGPGVVVEKGATVTNSVVFADTVIAEGAEVHWSIVDSRVRIGPEARVGEPDGGGTDEPEQVTLVGKESVVGPGARVPTGARLEPGTTA